MGIGNQHRAEILLAGMDTTFAYLVVLTACILAQEKTHASISYSCS